MDLASVLFSLEIFNFVAHICVLTGLRMLPRRALVKQHFYFIFDLVCCMLSFAIHRRAWPIILTQNIQHVYYIVTWDSRLKDYIFLVSFMMTYLACACTQQFC